VFNVGPFEMLVLAAVALIVFGPDKLPQLAKDAGRMLRTLRDMAQGARSQLTDELGPEFADFDLRSLNPRTAIRNALLGDEELPKLNPREVISRALRGEDEPEPRTPRTDEGQPQPAAAAPTAAAPAPSAGAVAPEAGPARYESEAAAPYYQDPTSVPYDPDAT
jgi:sec-independent protein translocase protein TatB